MKSHLLWKTFSRLIFSFFIHYCILYCQTFNGIGISIFLKSSIRELNIPRTIKKSDDRTNLRIIVRDVFMTNEKNERKTNFTAKFKSQRKKKESGKNNFESRNKNVATFLSGYSSYSVLVALVIIMKCANIHTFEWLCYR